jgi:hypothetical protein
MWDASRWTARFLVLVMLVSSFGPLTMACAAQPAAMHCMHHSAPVHSAEPAMKCHHAMAHAKPPRPESSQVESSLVESSEASFQADNCCQSQRCWCCCATTSEWAQPVSNLLSVLSLLIESARPSPSAVLHASEISGHDSARAPPRS